MDLSALSFVALSLANVDYSDTTKAKETTTPTVLSFVQSETFLIDSRLPPLFGTANSSSFFGCRFVRKVSFPPLGSGIFVSLAFNPPSAYSTSLSFELHS